MPVRVAWSDAARPSVNSTCRREKREMQRNFWGAFIVVTCMAAVWTAAFVSAQDTQGSRDDRPTSDDTIHANALDMFKRGRQTFRFDTFGDEHFWGDTLKLHQAIEGSRFGGVGPGVSPATALAVGLKVDAEALPDSLVDAIPNGRIDLNDPANTLALLNLNAVVGVRAIGGPDGNGGLRSMGITCALCHSTVDDAIAPGIGRRRDGWPNRDLNVGAIVALSPD